MQKKNTQYKIETAMTNHPLSLLVHFPSVLIFIVLLTFLGILPQAAFGETSLTFTFGKKQEQNRSKLWTSATEDVSMEYPSSWQVKVSSGKSITLAKVRAGWFRLSLIDLPPANHWKILQAIWSGAPPRRNGTSFLLGITETEGWVGKPAASISTGIKKRRQYIRRSKAGKFQHFKIDNN